jgi:hypothetical protein
VPPLSGRTRAELANCIDNCYSHSQIGVLFTRFDVEPTGGNKLTKSTALVEAMHGRGDGDGSLVLDLARAVLEDRFGGRVVDRDGSPNQYLRPLLDALRVDGYEMADGRLISSGVGSLPMTEQISLLETRLRARGMAVAVQHYVQAVDSFTDGRLEASNGQLRSCLEDVLLDLATRHGKATTDPKGAAEMLRGAGRIDGDEARLLQGLVGVSNERGAHRGTTTEEEATFRLHTTTAVLRYLLARVPDPT